MRLPVILGSQKISPSSLNKKKYRKIQFSHFFLIACLVFPTIVAVFSTATFEVFLIFSPVFCPILPICTINHSGEPIPFPNSIHIYIKNPKKPTFARKIIAKRNIFNCLKYKGMKIKCSIKRLKEIFP